MSGLILLRALYRPRASRPCPGQENPRSPVSLTVDSAVASVPLGVEPVLGRLGRWPLGRPRPAPTTGLRGGLGAGADPQHLPAPRANDDPLVGVGRPLSRIVARGSGKGLAKP